LVSSKMLDYTCVSFYWISKGIDVTLFEKAKKTFIKSNYAISYKGTNIIDLQGK
jgi:hypothetical protein